MLLWDTDWEKPPLKGEGNRRQAVEGFFREIFSIPFWISQKHPSVKPAACQLP